MATSVSDDALTALRAYYGDSDKTLNDLMALWRVECNVPSSDKELCDYYGYSGTLQDRARKYWASALQPAHSLYNFDANIGSWTGDSPVHETTIKRTGGGSIKMRSDGFYDDANYTARDLSMHGRTVYFWIWVPVTNSGTLRVFPGIQGPGPGYGQQYGAGFTLAKGVWNKVPFHVPVDALRDHGTLNLSFSDAGGTVGTDPVYLDDVQVGTLK